MRVLVADDELFLRGMIEEDLLKMGCDVTLVENGNDAVKQLGTDEFDVAIVDIRMPGKDGLEVLESIRGLDSPPEVLMMTAHATVETALQAMKLGAYDYLTKPFQLSELEMQ